MRRLSVMPDRARRLSARLMPSTVRVLVSALGASLLLSTCREDHGPAAPTELKVPTLASLAPPGSVTFVGAGDISLCSHHNDTSTAKLLDTIPGTVFTTGDNVGSPGDSATYANCYNPTWGRQKGRTFPVPGDVEYAAAGAPGYYGYFGAAAGDPTKGYYSYNLGAWHIIALNSATSMAAGSAQELWLKADLAANTSQCTLAYWHLPAFYSGTSTLRSAVLPLWNDLYAARADFVLNSHTRNYERFAPQTPAAILDTAQGIREFIVGTGGLGTWSFYTIAPNSLVRAQVYGVLKFTLSPGSYSWKFIPIAGTQFSDSGSAACHNSAPPPPPPPPPPPTPAVNAGPDRSTYPGVAANLSIAFSDTGATDAPWSYQILWGDGSSSTGSTSSAATPITASHAYSALGLDSVHVSVTNSAGRTGSDSLSVGVLAPEKQKVLFGGDIADCNNSGRIQTASILDTIAGTVIAGGDNAYPSGASADLANCYAPTWGRQLFRTYAAIGNHDYGLGNANGSWDYFGAAAGPRGLGYYSVDIGSWHVVVLNSNYTFVPTAVGSAQELWLKSDLAGAAGKCIVAVWHHPRFYSSTGPLSAGTSTLPFWNDLYAAHADLILNGHMHDYERFAQTDPSGNLDLANGIREIIAGTGGGGLDGPNTVFWPNSQVRISGVFGVLKLTLSSTAYSWRFIPVAGQTATDSGTTACHNAGAAVNHPPTAAPGGRRWRVIDRGTGVMARGGAGIGRRLSRHRDEPPAVGGGRERELEHAEHAADADLTVRPEDRIGAVQAAPTRARDDLADAVGEIEVSGRVGLRETLIIVHVAIEDQVRMRGVQVVPERQCGGAGGERARRRIEPGVMPHRENAFPRRPREIGLEPQLLSGAYRGRHERVVAVQHHDVPRPDVDAVVAEAARPGRGAKVVPRAVRVAQAVIVVADGRVGAEQLPPPGGCVTVRQIGARPAWVRVVATRDDGSGDGVQNARRLDAAGVIAVGDVSAEQHHLRARRHHAHRERVRSGPSGAVGDRHVHAVEAERGVRVAGGYRCRCARRAARTGAAVAPQDLVAPRRVGRPGVAERDRQVGRYARIRRAVRTGIHRRRGRGRRGRRRRGRRVVARSRARVRELGARNRDELPGIAPGREREFQDAVHLRAHQAVGRDRVERPRAEAARADDELPDPLGGVEDGCGRLRGEPLVVPRVRVQHHVGVRGVQVVPQRQHRRADGGRAGVKRRQMPVGERALRGGGGQVRLEPQLLRRTRRHGGRAVQRDDVPGAQVVAVVALGRIARGRAEVAVVARRAGGGVLSIARHGEGPPLLPPPGRVVAIGIGGAVARRADVVARSEHSAGNRVEQLGGGGVVVVRAEGDVACSDEGDRPRRRKAREGWHLELGWRSWTVVLATGRQEQGRTERRDKNTDRRGHEAGRQTTGAVGHYRKAPHVACAQRS